MIPADVTSRLQIAAETALRPVATAQDVSDKLAGLVAGQKVIAEIQALLPGGAYRAVINQRNITLALPFSAKAGDSLELQVSESDGKLTLAVLARNGSDSRPANESVATTLSRTGQLIGKLYAGTSAGPESRTALPLNANQPLSAAPPDNGGALAPLLKQAVAQSGMFYESHQAEWVEGRLTTTALLQEPQGKLSTPAVLTAAQNQGEATAEARSAPTPPPPQGATLSATQETSVSPTSAPSSPPSPTIAPQLQALVQQQLEAFATQNFAWQGQIWPGQEMQWEIDENAGRRPGAREENAPSWASRLRLDLPRLGGIEASLQLQGNRIALNLNARSAATRDLLQASGASLRGQFDAAGLALISIGVERLADAGEDGHV